MRTCQYVNARTANYCGAYADFVLDTSFTGLASCRRHLGPLLVPAMGADGNAAGERCVTVLPVHMHEDLVEARKAGA